MADRFKPARVASASLLRMQSDERLAALARDGHEAAFDALVGRYRPELVRASRRIVGESRSEDAVQQALLNAHRAIDTTADVTNLRAWLHKITHNSSLNMLRSVHEEVSLDAVPQITAHGGDPEDAATLRERLRETLDAIDALPEKQRAALLLREFEGRSHDEIAAPGVTSSAARQALMRGRSTVRHALSALTPYGLIAKLAAGASPGTTAGLAELIGGAGAGATMLKLGATVAATGALAGGVVGTDMVISDKPTQAAIETTTQQRSTTNRGPVAIPVTTTDDSHSRSDDSGKGHSRGRDDKRSGDSGKARGRSGKDDTTKSSDNSGKNRKRGKDDTTKSSDNSGKNRKRGKDETRTTQGVPTTSTPASASGHSSGSSGSSRHGGRDSSGGDDR